MFVSPGGGMVMSPYLGHQPPAPMPYQYSFDRQRFLQLALNHDGNTDDHRILCVFDGDEGLNEQEHPLRTQLHDLLVEKGLEPSYWDLAKGLPKESQSAGVPWMISWFQDSELRGAKAYLDFLRRRVYEGCRVLILGEIGALRERGQGNWLPRTLVNGTLSAIGFSYGGQWSNQSSLFEGQLVDGRYLTASAKVLGRELEAFRLFEIQHPRGVSIFQVLRKDSKRKSDMALVTPFGAYVDASLMTMEKPEGRRFRLEAFTSDFLERQILP